MTNDLNPYSDGKSVLRSTARTLERLQQRAWVRKHCINLDSKAKQVDSAPLMAGEEQWVTHLQRQQFDADYAAFLANRGSMDDFGNALGSARRTPIVDDYGNTAGVVFTEGREQ